jgi:alkaline phosphatase
VPAPFGHRVREVNALKAELDAAVQTLSQPLPDSSSSSSSSTDSAAAAAAVAAVATAERERA